MSLIHAQDEAAKARRAAFDSAAARFTIPPGYEWKETLEGTHNGQDVWIFRCEKAGGEEIRLGGEHFSFTVARSDWRVLGVAWLDSRFASGQPLPSREETEQIALAWLERVQPGLSKRVNNLWTEPHDEPLTADGRDMTVTGMKYKCAIPGDDTYAWVIVGPDRNVMVFEQAIIWDGGRLTEKWLHDSWLKERLAL